MKEVILARQEEDISKIIPIQQWGFVYRVNEGIRKHNSLKDFKFNHKDMKGDLQKVSEPYKPKNFIAPFGFLKE